MNRYSKNTKWFGTEFKMLGDLKQKPIMVLNGLISINVELQPKLYLRWLDMLEQKIREGNVKSTYFKETNGKRLNNTVFNTFAIQDKKYYLESKIIGGGHLLTHCIYEMDLNSYEYYRCVVHGFIHMQKQGRILFN